MIHKKIKNTIKLFKKIYFHCNNFRFKSANIFSKILYKILQKLEQKRWHNQIYFIGMGFFNMPLAGEAFEGSFGIGGGSNGRIVSRRGAVLLRQKALGMKV